jgi:ABC-2 type transport system permease protein
LNLDKEKTIMKKIFLVAQREFRQKVRSRAFLFGAIATPLILVVSWLFGGAFDSASQQDLEEDLLSQKGADFAVGVVDRADLIQTLPEQLPADVVQTFPDLEAAKAALESQEISAYYVISEDYRETGSVRRVSRRLPIYSMDTDLFDWVLVNNLFPEKTPAEIRRLRWPFDNELTFVPVSPEEGGQQDGTGNTMLPFLVSIAVMIPLFTGGSYLFQSLTEEKSSRIMEILLISLKPRQLLTGKLLGLGLLVFVQYAIWIAMYGVVILVTGRQMADFLSGIQLSFGETALFLPYALGGFALYAALMAGIGALAPDMEGSRAWTFIITLPMLLPVYLWMPIVNNPRGLLATILSLFPYSAPVAMLMRMTTTTVPAWQLAVSLGLLAAAGVGTVWLMSRLFHAKELLSGEPLSLARFRTALTQSG